MRVVLCNENNDCYYIIITPTAARIRFTYVARDSLGGE